MPLADSNAILLFGGNSDEARVSVASAQNISRHIPDAQLWFWAATGELYAVTASALRDHSEAFIKDFEPTTSVSFPDLDTALASLSSDACVFLALHGGAGENGEVQEKLQQRRVSFTGSDAVSSANAFDKNEAKRIAASVGVQIASGTSLAAGHPDPKGTLEALLRRHSNLILKPVAGGSSIGMFHLRSAKEVAHVLAEVQKKHVPYLVEPFLKGREFTVGVTDLGGGAEPLPPSEIQLEGDADFDFEGKYLGRHSLEITPARIPESLTRALQATALKCHEALGCFGYSRTDLIVTENGEIYFIELNTLPGLTKASFIPQQLEAGGHRFETFLKAQLTLARHRVPPENSAKRGTAVLS